LEELVNFERHRQTSRSVDVCCGDVGKQSRMPLMVLLYPSCSPGRHPLPWAVPGRARPASLRTLVVPGEDGTRGSHRSWRAGTLGRDGNPGIGQMERPCRTRVARPSEIAPRRERLVAGGGSAACGTDMPGAASGAPSGRSPSRSRP
jgi:hypothetical protein